MEKSRSRQDKTRSPAQTTLAQAALIALTISVPSLWADQSMDFFDEERIVTASKHAQKLSQTPANVDVITADDIRRYGYRSVDEALQSVPGFFITDDRNYTYIWTRGFGRPGDYNNRILLLLNGHRLNDTLYDAAPTGTMLGLDMGIISRIEVMKGPSSALYGNNAFFGVVNVITQTPSNAPRVAAAVEGGSYGTKRASAEMSGVTREGVGIFVSANHREMEGRRFKFPEYAATNDGIPPKKADREKHLNILGIVSFKGWELTGMHVKREKGIPTGSFDAVMGNTDNQTTDETKFVELKGEQRLSDGVHASIRLYHNWSNYSGVYIIDDEPLARNEDIGRNRWFGDEFVLRFLFPGQGNNLMIGQEAEKNLEQRQMNYDVNPRFVYLSNNQKSSRTAYFVQQEWNPLSKLNLTIGLRYDRYSTFDPVMNPRFAAIYKLSHDSLVKLFFGKAFRGPTPYELYYQDGVVSKANPNLSPERMMAYEIYLEKRFRAKGVLGMSLFDRHISNLISQIIDPADGKTHYLNRDRIRSQGIEVEANWALTNLTKSRLGALCQKSRTENGETVANSPYFVGNAGLSHDLTRLKSTVGLETMVIGSRRSVKNTKMSSDTLFNFIFTTTPWAHGPRFYAAVYNLTNENHSASGGEEHRQATIKQNDRNYTIGLEYRLW